MGHGGFHGGLWQRLMLMMLEAEGACGPRRLACRLVAAADAHDAGAADAHDAGGRGGLCAMGHGGFHSIGLWQRLMLMMLEAEGACGPRRLPWSLVAEADAYDAGAADAHDAGGRGCLWATEASMEACGSG